MTRNEAFDRLLQTIEEQIPETVSDWPEKRKAVRDAALAYCHVAVNEAVQLYVSPWNPT